MTRTLEYMNGLGPRLTGNAAHASFIAYLKSELESFGLTVHTDSTPFTRWEQKTARLSITSPHTAEIPISSAFPYSGSTPPEGVTGELIDCLKKSELGSVKDKIVLAETRVAALPSRIVFKRRRGTGSLPFLMKNPVVAATLNGDLKKYRDAGAKGVIFVWIGLSTENATGQHLPFTTPYQDCPALYVSPDEGRALRALLKRGCTVNLTLEAEVTESTSDTLYALLPGKNTGECVIINTHTDGPNACEENGPVGLLALAKHFTALPLEDRERSLVFVFVTGHFQLPQFGLNGQATTRWLAEHPELWEVGQGCKAVAGLTLEHLGAMEWRDTKDPGGGYTYAPTGKPERELIYAGNQIMADIYRRASAGRTRSRPVLLKPARMYFGEGEPLYNAGIPTLSLVPAPQYLCAATPGGGLDKLDPGLMDEQVRTFAEALRIIDRTPAEDLGAGRSRYGDK